MFGKKKVGIALSGGAARGIAHIGVLQVLEGLGVKIDAVSGCSMGAIVGAIYSLGTPLKELEDYIENTDWRSFMVFSMFSLSSKGIINEHKIVEVLKKFLGDKTFDDCQIPFNAVSVDIIKGQKVVFNSGRLIDAVRASIAVPGIIPPVCKDGMLLVDGGIIEPVPTEALRALKANFIIASSISFEIEDQQVKELEECSAKDKDLKKISVQVIIDKSLNLIQNQMARAYVERADIVIEPKSGKFGFFDFIKGQEIIDSGRKAATAKIPEIKRKLKIR
jgi:NTE family protein